MVVLTEKLPLQFPLVTVITFQMLSIPSDYAKFNGVYNSSKGFFSVKIWSLKIVWGPLAQALLNSYFGSVGLNSTFSLVNHLFQKYHFGVFSVFHTKYSLIFGDKKIFSAHLATFLSDKLFGRFFLFTLFLPQCKLQRCPYDKSKYE